MSEFFSILMFRINFKHHSNTTIVGIQIPQLFYFISDGARRPCVVCTRQTEGGRNTKRSRIRTYCPDCNLGFCRIYCFRIDHKRQNVATHRRGYAEE